MSVTIHVTDYTRSMGDLQVDFDTRLQRRGTDFNVFANNRYTPHHDDSTLLKDILSSLINFDTGVVRVSVEPYTIRIKISKAVESGSILNLIENAIRRQNQEVNRRN